MTIPREIIWYKIVSEKRNTKFLVRSNLKEIIRNYTGEDYYNWVISPATMGDMIDIGRNDGCFHFITGMVEKR